MELNRKDYRLYKSTDCRKCAMFIPDGGYGTCRLNRILDKEWKCWSSKPPYTKYIFKLIKKG